MQSTNVILIQKLDEFIRKYYKNKLIKGTIYSSALVLGAFLSIILLEFFGEFNSLIRGILFFGFLGATLTVLVNYIFTPLLKLNKIGTIISYNQAATIIGSHFTNVQDKLLNVLHPFLPITSNRRTGWNFRRDCVLTITFGEFVIY